MQRFFTFAAACLLSGAMAFAQGAGQQAPATGTGQSSNTVSTTPNSNGTSPSNAQGSAARTPSSPNQALPGDTNPANASTSDAGANGRAVTPNKSATGAAGTAAGNSPSTGNAGDNSDNNGMAKDDTGNNPASGRGSNTITNPQTSGTTQWFWIALGIIIGLIVIGVLASRNRARGNIDRTDPALRATDTRSEADRIRDRDRDRIRRVG